MSSIASFKIFEKTTLDEYVMALRVPMPNRSRAALLKHPIHKFSKSVATELTPFQWSGYVFAFELPLYLRKHSVDYRDFIARKPSAKLSEAMGGPAELFSTPSTKKLSEKLDEILDNQQIEVDIEKFLKKFPKTEQRTDPKLPVRAVFDAVLIFRYWLSRVPPGYFGELSI